MKDNSFIAAGIGDILSDAKMLYSNGRLASRIIQQLRPYICPFHELVSLVPENSSILDVGCGSGLFIGLLAIRQNLKSALGFDFSESAIMLSNAMLGNMPEAIAKNITFELRNANQSWPEGSFDVVSMIDVMHHVDPAAQHKVFLEAVDHAVPGGLILYKDMANKPLGFAMANRFHDLIMARQWINYVPIALIKKWGIEAGLDVAQESQCRMLWYAHEWIVFKRNMHPINQASA